MDGLDPLAWRDLFVVIGTAAAALIGLELVAISLHHQQVERHPILRHRARTTLGTLGVMLMISLADLIPGISAFWYGVATVTSMVGYLGFASWSIAIAQRRMRGLPSHVWLRQMPNLLVLLAVAAGVSLIVGKGSGLYLEAPMLVVAIPIVLFNVWSLLFAPELRSSERDTDLSIARRGRSRG